MNQYPDDSQFPTEWLLFPVEITDLVDDGGTWYYAAKEQRFVGSTGAYEDADPARVMTTTGNNRLVEVNNAEVSVPCFAWVRYKGVVNQRNTYEFCAPATGAAEPYCNLIGTLDAAIDDGETGYFVWNDSGGGAGPFTAIVKVADNGGFHVDDSDEILISSDGLYTVTLSVVFYATITEDPISKRIFSSVQVWDDPPTAPLADFLGIDGFIPSEADWLYPTHHYSFSAQFVEGDLLRVPIEWYAGGGGSADSIDEIYAYLTIARVGN